MASVVSVLAKISANTSSFVGGMKQATAAAQDFNRNAVQGTKQAEQQANANMSKFGQGAIKVGTLVKGALLGVLAIQGKQFLQGAIGQASNFEAEFEGVNQTFKGGAKVVQDFAKTAAQTAGLAETTALRFAKSFGGYATSAGLAGKAQGEFATQMVQAAGDLGSFFDLPTESALMAIQQGLRGEYEPLRRFNILLDEATIGQKAMSMGLSDTGKNLTQQQKILARQKLIMEGLGVAQGDFVKYGDTYGNSIKTVSALFQNLQKDVGGALLPSLAKLSQALIPIVQKLAPILQKVIEKLSPVIEKVAASLDKLLPALDPIVDAFGMIIDVVVDVLDVLLEPIMTLVNAAAPLIKDFVAALASIAKALLPILKPFIDLLVVLLVPIMQVLAALLKFVAWEWQQLGKVFQWVYDNVIQPIWDALSEAVNTVMQELADAFGVDQQALFEAFGRAFEDMWKSFLEPVMKAIVEGVKWIVGKIKEWTPIFARAVKRMFGPLIDIIKWLEEHGYIKIRYDVEHETKDRMATGGMKDLFAQDETIGGTNNPNDKKGTPVKNPIIEFYKKLAEEIRQQRARVALAAKGLNDDLIERIVGFGDGWEKIYKYVLKGGSKAIKDLESKFAQTAAGFGKIAEAVKSSMAQIHDSIINGFSLTGFGRSAKQVLVNARRMVEKAKQFGNEIVNLAKMKLNPALLNQIIAAGPVEGLALAKSLSGAGQPTIDELNSLYNQAGSIATSTAKEFAKTQTNYYIEVSGGIGDKNTIGKAIVEAVKAYERQNGKVFSV